MEISSYLAQSTDLAPEFPAIKKACAERGIDFLPLELDEAAAGLAGRPAGSTLVWTLTDGVAYFRGGAAPARSFASATSASASAALIRSASSCWLVA